MRLRLLAAAIAVLTSSLVAKADTFIFTPTGGTAITFSTDGLTAHASTDAPYNYIEYNLSPGTRVDFFGDSEANAYASFGYGHFDFQYVSGLTSYFEDGPQLFAGALASSTPTFAAATYTLVADHGSSTKLGGTLVVNGGTPAAVTPAAVAPEPSSLALLGTGIVGVLGAARRRLLA